MNTAIAVGHGICTEISTYGEDGVDLAINQGIASGFSGNDTGSIVAGALNELCPENWPTASAAVDGYFATHPHSSIGGSTLA